MTGLRIFLLACCIIGLPWPAAAAAPRIAVTDLTYETEVSSYFTYDEADLRAGTRKARESENDENALP